MACGPKLHEDMGPIVVMSGAARDEEPFPGGTTMVDSSRLQVPRLGKKPLGLMDLGTNSLRLLVVRRVPDGAVETLLETKETVRLGEGAYEAGALTEVAMDRTVAAFARLAENARSEGVETLYAVGTAALRDAANGETLRRRIEAETGVSVAVISGEEEARLTYLGVASGIRPLPERLVVVDIGGGSTELAAGELLVVRRVTSLPVGAIRITEERFEGGEAPIPAKAIEAAREYVRGRVPADFRDAEAMVVTAGGTGLNLADVAAKWQGEKGTAGPVSREELATICTDLGALTAEERCEVPGLSPRRADIIVGGGAILLGVLDALGAPEFRASDMALRHGLALLAASGSPATLLG